jgi:hypothetical protein
MPAEITKEESPMTARQTPHDPTDDPLAHPDEPGAYVGGRPERQAETIPGGVRPGDERIAANASESSGSAPPREPDRRGAGPDR